MIVKKIAADWYPSENNGLRVGDTIDITDPKQLILDGKVQALDENGVEVSAYDLYGVLVQNEVEDFEAYLKMKKQEALKKQLDKERTELDARIAAQERIKAQEKPAEPAAPASAPVTPEPVKPVEAEKTVDAKKGK